MLQQLAVMKLIKRTCRNVLPTVRRGLSNIKAHRVASGRFAGGTARPTDDAHRYSSPLKYLLRIVVAGLLAAVPHGRVCGLAEDRAGRLPRRDIPECSRELFGYRMYAIRAPYGIKTMCKVYSEMAEVARSVGLLRSSGRVALN
jgi:hypothetical protein